MRLLHRGCLNVLVTGLVSVALCASASASGALCAGLFEDQIIIWKSVDDLEQAVEKIARGELSDGDLDDLLECWASPGTPVTLLGNVEHGELLHVQLEGEKCEGVIFKEEYDDRQ